MGAQIPTPGHGPWRMSSSNRRAAKDDAMGEEGVLCCAAAREGRHGPPSSTFALPLSVKVMDLMVGCWMWIVSPRQDRPRNIKVHINVVEDVISSTAVSD